MAVPVIPDWLLGLTTAVNVVNSQTEKLNTWGTAYQGKLDGALDKLSSISLPDISDPQRLAPPNVGGAGSGPGDAPDWSAAAPGRQNPPSPPTYGTASGAQVDPPPTPPDLTISINIPPAPTFIAPQKPNRPNINTDITLPDAPVVNFGRDRKSVV